MISVQHITSILFSIITVKVLLPIIAALFYEYLPLCNVNLEIKKQLETMTVQ